ncbi:MAG TPA: biopolymer transporter ExbD [Spirochaetota bacterium]|nr:biopolymer transporter ExbD [Spirochaetota bacterium]
MKIKGYKSSAIKSEINITPFTDVVLVLLIIFMITTPIIIQSSITVSLPKSKYGEQGSVEQFNVTIKNEQEIYFNNKIVDVASLKNELSDYVKKNPEAPLVIKADKDIKYFLIIEIMDMAKEAGVGKISLNVEKR